MTTRTLAAVAERDGRTWLVSIPELGTALRASTVSEVDTVARAAAAQLLDLPESEIELMTSVRVTPQAGPREPAVRRGAQRP
ncbi:hypothetical protein [Rathayibacter sp. Leaf296]|uniref:hypothetical protein n=1 Tax=Rathayibacter sp. Leaf296 TaxID=1736327 RepID=UPI0007031497|nr:hypothetical protein [Rathayibacter sp. Leaf296]KQQ08480.1 hypothetical protein ASF46_14355 [Rathayibacter sp. Leaf296]